MHYSALKQSNYLTQADCEPPILVKIAGMTEEKVGDDNKFVLHFSPPYHEKGMVLNSTNGTMIKDITGQEDTDNWTGAQIVLFRDSNIEFGGRKVGGIRVRAPRGKHNPNVAAKVKPAAPEIQPDASDDVPF